mmetsp:Transcript_19702/g.32298  ORF Transcript_19702/g.32298 Transcript_19702/m.32298 type:complete len:80 (+) Transcript_19702:86-325(+)
MCAFVKLALIRKIHTFVGNRILREKTHSILLSRRPHFSMQPTSRLPLKGIVFDMDGTLTKDGAIDFADMRKRANIPEGY